MVQIKLQSQRLLGSCLQILHILHSCLLKLAHKDYASTVKPSHYLALLTVLFVHLLLIIFLGGQFSLLLFNSSRNRPIQNLSIIKLLPQQTKNNAITSIADIPPQQVASYPNKKTLKSLTSTTAITEQPLNLPFTPDDLSTISTSYYFESTELSENPHLLYDLSPSFPLALNGELTGTTKFHVFINEEGAVDRFIFDKTGLSEDNQNLIVRAFLSMKFEPGKIHTIPVKSILWFELQTK